MDAQSESAHSDPFADVDVCMEEEPSHTWDRIPRGRVDDVDNVSLETIHSPHPSDAPGFRSLQPSPEQRPGSVPNQAEVKATQPDSHSLDSHSLDSHSLDSHSLDSHSLDSLIAAEPPLGPVPPSQPSFTPTGAGVTETLQLLTQQYQLLDENFQKLVTYIQGIDSTNRALLLEIRQLRSGSAASAAPAPSVQPAVQGLTDNFPTTPEGPPAERERPSIKHKARGERPRAEKDLAVRLRLSC
jgi:hypothetical protein